MVVCSGNESLVLVRFGVQMFGQAAQPVLFGQNTTGAEHAT
ncbi:hypothetical protein [Actinomadura nitritigenes]